MFIGVLKEVKNHKYQERRGLIPSSISELITYEHQVVVQSQVGISFNDEDYMASDAKINSTTAKIFAVADMIIKLKKPQPTIHSNSSYVVDDVLHCISNMPGLVISTAIFALNKPTFIFNLTEAFKRSAAESLGEKHTSALELKKLQL